MKKITCIVSTLILLLIVGCSDKVYRQSVGKENTVSERESGADDAEGAVQEPAWTYYERLSYLFGADSTCVGMRNDMDFPDWYSGCFVNNRNRLTINVVGDTIKLRSTLDSLLSGNEFDLGIGVCSKKEQIKTHELLMAAIAKKYKGDLTTGLNEDGTIEISIVGDNDSVVGCFKNEVFDSPILRFEIAGQVGFVSDYETIDNDEAFITHESSPQFPGGDAAMLDYIYDNLKYPKEAYDENIQGRVVVRYLVDKNGIVDSIQVLRSKDPYLDAEAVRLISILPKFVPGKWDCTPIDQWMALPIMFKLSDYEARMGKKYPAFQYDNGDDYVSDGLYRVVDERGKIGYADERGNTVITPRFAFGFPFENGKARVTDYGEEKEVEGSRGEYHYWESDDWYYIDKTGRKLDN